MSPNPANTRYDATQRSPTKQSQFAIPFRFVLAWFAPLSRTKDGQIDMTEAAEDDEKE